MHLLPRKWIAPIKTKMHVLFKIRMHLSQPKLQARESRARPKKTRTWKRERTVKTRCKRKRARRS